MADRPPAEVEVGPGLVRALLAEQCPVVDGIGPVSAMPVELVAQGWDNSMFRLGEDLAVRLPRRQLGAALLRNEQAWLGQVADRVDVPVPVPVFAGRPGAGYPWHWSVVPWIGGRAAGTVDRTDRRRLAEPLGRFVTQLAVPAPPDAPVNRFRGVPLAARDAVVDERLDLIRHPRTDDLRSVWDEARSAPAWDGPPLWLHGDLHPFNIIVDDSPLPRLRAVVDFGDMTSGDPACDLAAAWLVLDPEGRETFRHTVDAARGPGEDAWRRARGWALVMSTSMLADSDDDPVFARLGADIVDEVLVDR
ncbi:aminoglycoside phosphotransferase family protein [Sanguibacter suaedae]|uniref:Aminoglycoside phosphotransferase family protein n=1 Tax=Sanguibacter suaedae TaxID=2795737 RepID=A0A934IA82_9MICO|nr:aminoglycoside phosphotransferase family protein [Sanguibacter suaedae]MBI9114203.1 aminoglycoside phosphotransferase family protein [Sanguibacter suaedae]